MGCALDLFQGFDTFVDLERCSTMLHDSSAFYDNCPICSARVLSRGLPDQLSS